MPPYGDIFACTFNYFYCLLLIFNCINNLPDLAHTCQEYLYTKNNGVGQIWTLAKHYPCAVYAGVLGSALCVNGFRKIYLE